MCIVALPVFVTVMRGPCVLVPASWAAKASVVRSVEIAGAGADTATALENELVLPLGSMEVAVTSWPGASVTGNEMLNVALHDASVVTSAEPMNVRPALLFAASVELLEKNSTRNIVLAVELCVPVMVVVPPVDT